VKRIALILILLLCVCFFAGCDYEPTVFSDEFEMSVFYAATSKEYWLTITHFNEEKENYFIPKNKEYYPNERKYQKKIDSRIGEIKVLDDFLCCSNQNVKSITFDNEMRIGIEYGCFMNCRNLTEVKNAAVIHSISDWAFMNCVNLTAINLDGIEDISKLAFSGCVKLKQVFIGEKIKYIGYNAFANCNEELSVTVTATEPPEIKYGVFDGIEHLTIKVPADSMESYKNAEGWNEYSDKIIKIAQ
jgi:cell surface protein